MLGVARTWFPKHRSSRSLRGIEIGYSCWGWVEVGCDLMPRIFQPDPKQTIYYALGYGGNGVMYFAQAGWRMAEQVAGKAEKPNLPVLRSPLPEHLFSAFRRLGPRLLYNWYYLKDEVI